MLYPQNNLAFRFLKENQEVLKAHLLTIAYNGKDALKQLKSYSELMTRFYKHVKRAPGFRKELNNQFKAAVRNSKTEHTSTVMHAQLLQKLNIK